MFSAVITRRLILDAIERLQAKAPAEGEGDALKAANGDRRAAAASLCGLPFPDALGKRRRMSESAQQPDDQAKWVTEADIDRAAKLVIKLRGAGAYDRAFQRFGDLSLTGDDEAAAIWRRIVKAIERLQAKPPAEGEKVH